MAPTNRVIFEADHVHGVSGQDIPGTSWGFDDALDLDHFRSSCRIEIHSISPSTLCFDLIGTDAAIANALRRVMIAECPTMAIETCSLVNNTSIMPDEMVAHRIGLVPIKADPRLFLSHQQGDDHTDVNSLLFKLHVKCEDSGMEPKFTRNIQSRDLVFQPIGSQAERLNQPPRFFQHYWLSTYPDASTSSVYPLHQDVVISKIKVNQEINVNNLCIKGVGKDHAKFSPVSVATYRLMPDIQIEGGAFRGDLETCVRFQKCFAPGVIEVCPSSTKQKGEYEAVVLDPRKETMSREVLRWPEFKDKVKLTRVRDHFIFQVESVGQYDSPAEIVLESCKVLVAKCMLLKKRLAALSPQQ